MPLSTQENIKNTPLNGWELQQYALWLLKRSLETHAVLSDLQIQTVIRLFDVDMGNDYVFSRGTMYPNVEISIEFRCHVIEDRWSFTLSPSFMFMNPAYPVHVVFIHRPTTIPSPPLTAETEQDEHVVDCFKVQTRVDNPNLVRVHLNLPIIVTRTVMPDRAKNRPMVTFEDERIVYDPADYDPLPPPTETDESRAYAKMWNLKGDIEYPVEDAKAWEEQEPLALPAPEPLLLPAPEEPDVFNYRVTELTDEERKRQILLASGIELTDEERAAALRTMGVPDDEPPPPAPEKAQPKPKPKKRNRT